MQSRGERFTAAATRRCIGIVESETTLHHGIDKIDGETFEHRCALRVNEDLHIALFNDGVGSIRCCLQLHLVLQAGTTATGDAQPQPSGTLLASDKTAYGPGRFLSQCNHWCFYTLLFDQDIATAMPHE